MNPNDKIVVLDDVRPHWYGLAGCDFCAYVWGFSIPCLDKNAKPNNLECPCCGGFYGQILK